MRRVIFALPIALAGCETAGPADYVPSAVVEGQVVDGEARPVSGLSIAVWILAEGCADDPASTVPDPDPVLTGVDGTFAGRFETLAGGPISVACLIVEASDQGGGVVAEVLIEEPTEWMSPPRDTIVAQLTT